MKILIRKHPEKEWKHLSQTKYSKEEDLKDILFSDPKARAILVQEEASVPSALV